MNKVPPQLRFNQLQTKAFFSVYKQWPIQPIANSGQYWPGQVIRVFFNALTDGGVMDPYRSHLQITVQCDQSTLPVGLLQVDNSAQSFIQQLVISSKNRQIQRIIQYGCLAAYLTDTGISQLYAQGKQMQGLGYSNVDNYCNIYNFSASTGKSGTYNDFQQTGGMQSHSVMTNGTVFPTIPIKYANFDCWGTQCTPVTPLNGIFRSHLSWLNSAWLNNQQQVWWWYIASSGGQNQQNCTDGQRVTSLSFYGYLNNIRAQYLASHMANNYVDSTQSSPSYQVRLAQNVQNNTFPSKFTNSTVYQTYIPQQIPLYMSQVQPGNDNQQLINQNVPNITSLHGFTNLVSPMFSKGVREPFISPTVPQCQMANGQILTQKIPVSKRTFKIPLISAIIGLLIPQSQFVLLPLKALDGMLMQFTIDQHAMFTSGYNDISQFDNVGMGLMQQRAFKVTRVVYNLHTYQFYSPQMDQYLKVSLNSGIAINTQFWQLGNQYQIQNSQSITNSWPVACNQQALNQVLTLFYPMDYQTFTFCRKHFRISNNITKLQLRINMQYYPSQPLSGNGGNPVEIDATGNNSVFLQQIFYTNGYLFDKQSPLPRINAYNFAINSRCYEITNSHTLYDPAMIDNPSYIWNPQSVNYDTAMGMSNLHQNRFVGKGAYVFSFQPYSHSQQFLTGIDCRAAKQFDIIFQSNADGWFQRAQMMLIYTRSSVIIQYGRDGIVNINK